MSLLVSMLPIYLLGNLHCIGMCGPLVMMIGNHPYRAFYFFGRIASFALAGALAGATGELLTLLLSPWHVPELASFFFGAVILCIGLKALTGASLPTPKWFSKKMMGLSQSLSHLILKEDPTPTFLFGFFTVLLPCGQTLVVFSACALSADVWVGLLNGAVFGILTTPSLWVAMRAKRLIPSITHKYNLLLGLFSLLVGGVALLRALASLQVIPHLVLSKSWHIVIF